ncbi:MAG TPA: PIN domain-containing protein [Candidatus Woesebacteria bacterium]|nr:PIN domain-containing protein [Candidatus Woesebacteria bacterium]
MYLLDTDFIIASRFPQESTHPRAKILGNEIYSTDDFLITELVLMEVATVISHKYSQSQAILAVQTLQKAGRATLRLDADDWKNTWSLFIQQQKRRTSVVDCSNTVLAQKLGAQVVSFDQFYQQFGVAVEC